MKYESRTKLKVTNRESTQGSINLSVAWRRETRVIHVVGYVGSKKPVVRAVLEQVEHRHGRVRKAVHEDSLDDSLGVMNAPTNGSNPWNKSRG